MEYLAKIVQIPFLLPRPGKPQLLKLVIGRQRESLQPAAGQGSRDEKSRPAGPRDRASAASPDRRGSFQASVTERLKRFVNRLRRQSDDQQPEPVRPLRGERDGESVSANGIPDDSREWETLALDDNDTETLVELAHQFNQNPRAYNRLLEVSKFPEVERLLSRRYDQASINQLREFLSQSPPLSVETAKELLPFTTNLTGIYE